MLYNVKKPILGFENVLQVELHEIDGLFSSLDAIGSEIISWTLVNPYQLREYSFDIPKDVQVLLDIKEDSDFASCSTNSENNYLIYQQQLKELQEINEALEAIKTNEYGICKMCEEPINPERLKIKPFAKYCIDCREIVEKEGNLR